MGRQRRPTPWQIALLNPGGAGAPLVWTALPMVAVAVLALLRGRAWGSAATSLTLLAPVLLALALVAPGIRLGTVPAGVEGAGEPIMLWSGLMLLPLRDGAGAGDRPRARRRRR